MNRLGLRARVALALVGVVLPAALVFFVVTRQARRQATLETAYEATVARMEEGGRERCERRPPRSPRRERRLLATYDAAFVARSPDAPDVPAEVRAAFAAGERAVVDPSSPRRALLRMPWSDGPCAVLLVELPHPARTSAGRDLVAMLAALSLSLLAAVVALASPLRRLRALVEATRRARGIAALQVPTEARGKDEIGALAASLESASVVARGQLTALEARARALRDYVDGTTHDLAVPLTVLQSHLSSLAEQPEVDRGAVDGALASASYLAQLTANLAAAARLEGDEPSERRPVDVAAVVERVLDRMGPIARQRRVEVAASLPDAGAVIEGDELLLERAISNLVHNAIRHRGDAPGHVAVLVAVDPLRIRVRSDGVPIDAAALAALKQGTVPADAARTRGRGIGLAIVRQVAARHGLSLDFARCEGDGLEVTLQASTSVSGSRR